MKSIVVRQIIKGENRRPVLYGDDPDYAVIADIPASQFYIKVGDAITYEPDGLNFGWLVR